MRIFFEISSVIYLFAQGVGALSTIMWAQVSAKIGKQKTYYVGGIVFMFTFLSTWFLPEAPHIGFLYCVGAFCGLGYGIGQSPTVTLELLTLVFYLAVLIPWSFLPGRNNNHTSKRLATNYNNVCRYYRSRRIGDRFEKRRSILRNFCFVPTRWSCHGTSLRNPSSLL